MPEPSPIEITIRHAMQLWFEPEMKRRQEAGLIEGPIPLKAAQVILYADKRSNEVRLNEEVQLIVATRLRRGTIKGKGDPVFLHEIEDIGRFELPETEDPNCGHLTILILGNEVYLAFDFRYNKARSRELVEAAEQFLDAAQFSLAKKQLRATAENLFCAAELAAKAYVITTPHPGFEAKKKRKFLHAQINLHRKLGNIDEDLTRAYNLLAEMRPKARYFEGDFEATLKEMAKLESSVGNLVEVSRSRLEWDCRTAA